MYILAHENKDHFRQLVNNEQVLLDSGSEMYSARINSTISDLKYLSSRFEFQIDENMPFHLIAREWQAFSDNKQLYDQIRFIDQNGEEKIRINYLPEGSVVVPDAQLQNKSDRYYFTETEKLEKGQVYVSKFDLNIENNQIEQPDKPMIRFSTPMYDRNNVFYGVIILNYYGKYLVNLLDNFSMSSAGHLFLLNSDGYWIFNNQDKSLEWSFMYDDKNTLSFKNQFPNEWEAIQSAESGQVETDRGYFIYRKILATKNEMSGANLQKDSIVLGEGNWTLVSFIPGQSTYGEFLQQHFHLIWSEQWGILVVFMILSNVIALLYQASQKAKKDAIKSRDQLLKFADQVPGMLYQYEITPDGKVRVPFSTDAIKDFFGCTPEEVREDSSPLWNVIYPGDLDRVHAAIAESAGNLSPFQLEYRVALPGQPLRWLMAKAMPEKKEDGSIVYHGFNADITNLKDIEMQLGDQEERFRLLFSTSLDAILITVPTGEILQANPAAENLFGRTEAEMRQLGRTGIVDLNDPRLPIAVAERSRTGLFRGELSFLHRDGTVFPAEIVSTIYTDSSGHERTSIFIRDITRRKQAEDLLKKERELFNSTLMAVEEGIVMAKLSGEILVFNHGAERITGYKKEEVLELNFGEIFCLVNVNTGELAHEYIIDMLKSGKRFDAFTDFSLVGKDGTEIRISTNIALIKGTKEQEDRVIASFRDISREYELEKQIESFLNVNLDMLCVSDKEGNFVRVNRKFEEILGYKTEELEGKSVFSFIHEDDLPKTKDSLKDLAQNKTLTGFVNRYRCKDGSYKYIEWQAEPGIRKYYYGSARDVTDKILYEEKLKDLAIRDELTMLYNRHYFETKIVDLMEHSDRYDEPLSFLIFDLDHFKNINDTFGHGVGDDVLKIVARSTERLVRDTDLIFRIGGEEFVILMPKTTIVGASLIAERLRAELENTCIPGIGRQTISIGVSERMKSESYKHWFNRTDEALYRAKQNGRNRVEASD